MFSGAHFGDIAKSVGISVQRKFKKNAYIVWEVSSAAPNTESEELFLQLLGKRKYTDEQISEIIKREKAEAADWTGIITEDERVLELKEESIYTMEEIREIIRAERLNDAIRAARKAEVDMLVFYDLDDGPLSDKAIESVEDIKIALRRVIAPRELFTHSFGEWTGPDHVKWLEHEIAIRNLVIGIGIELSQAAIKAFGLRRNIRGNRKLTYRVRSFGPHQKTAGNFPGNATYISWSKFAKLVEEIWELLFRTQSYMVGANNNKMKDNGSDLKRGDGRNHTHATPVVDVYTHSEEIVPEDD